MKKYVSQKVMLQKNEKNNFYFYLVRRHTIANNSATTEAREKIRIDLESLES